MDSSIYREVSTATSRAVFEDATRAHDDPGHPCHYLITDEQRLGLDGAWQLPVPFMGRAARAGIVFVGFNPSWSYPGQEADPCWGATFDEYDSYWRCYFSTRSDADLPRLYRKYQYIGEKLRPDFQLGDDAIVVEVVHFRSAKALSVKRAVIEQQAELTARVLGDVQPAVIFVIGNRATWSLTECLPALAPRLPVNAGITSLEGEVLEVDTPWGQSAKVVPWRHLTGAWVNQTRLDAAAECLASALPRARVAAR